MILLLGLPRIAMLFIWLLTDWFNVTYQSHFWPVLGFFFMPFTTLAYMGGMLNYPNSPIAGGWLVLLITAIIIDILNILGTCVKTKQTQEQIETIQKFMKEQKKISSVWVFMNML
jgi:hypothetical protein